MPPKDRDVMYALDERHKLNHYPKQREIQSSSSGGQEKFSRSILGQGVAAGLASTFQVYSGGIAIDTVSTRLQGGQSMRSSCFGSATGAFRPGQLFAGHAVAAYGRFPYLFVSLNSYAQTERACLSLRSDGASLETRRKSMLEEGVCIASATAFGSAMMTAVECPKVMAQLDQGGTRHSCVSIARQHGLMRLFRGYDSCCLREGVFHVAMFGAPSLGHAITDSNDRARARGETSLLDACSGIEKEVASFFSGLFAGFVTNGPDQLKTRIQHGQFKTFSEACAWQMKHGGGIRALYGPAAVFRAFYTAHAVLAVNFMRFRVETAIDAI